MTRLRLLTPVLALLLLVACSLAPPPAEVEAFEIDGLTTQTVGPILQTIKCPVDGADPVDLAIAVVGGWSFSGPDSGAEFLFFVPRDDWGRSLVLYARGYLPTSEPVGFPRDGIDLDLPDDVLALRDALLCQGFAVGASSYSDNGLAIKEGIRDTHDLNTIFKRLPFASPLKTYIMGQSMGGLITVALMERYPDVYAGAFPTCGPTAGSLAQLQYLGHVRVLVDYFFPSLFTENAITPTRQTLDDVNAAVDGLDQVALLKLASIRLPGSELFGGMPILPVDPAATTPAAQLQSLRDSLKEALYYYVVGMQDVLDRGRGQPFDNRLTLYTSSSLSALELFWLNRRVDRFRAESRALAYWTLWYQPKGSLSRPTLNAHTTHDPAVPFAHAVAYDQLVKLAGRSHNLLTMPVPRYGHCEFKPEELAVGIGALVQWATVGTKPTLPY